MAAEAEAPHPLDLDFDDEPEPPEPDALYIKLATTAGELYGTHGYQAVSLQDICTAAQVSEADFYARFSDTDELFCAAFRLHYEELRAHVLASLQNVASGPEATARRGLTAFYRFLRRRPTVARVVFVEGTRAGPKATVLYHQQIEDFNLAISVLLGSLYESGLPASEESQIWLIRTVIGATIMNTHMWVREDYATPEEELILVTGMLFRAIIQQWLGVLRLDKKLTAARLLPPGESYVSVGYVLPLIDYLRERRLPLEPVLELLGLDESDLGSHDRMIPADRETEALLLSHTLTGDEHVGLHVGERLQLPCLGVLGHLMMTCHTLEEALVLYRRFGALIREVGRMEIIAEGSQLYLTLRQPDGQPLCEPQRLSRILAGVISIARQLGGQHLAPQRIVFPFPAPADDSEPRRFFRCPLSYGGSELRCYILPEQASLPLPGSAPELRQALEAEATRQLHALEGLPTDADPRIAALKRYIGEQLRQGQPELAQAADALGTSPRNLRRLLESRRTSYSDIIEDVRRSQAAAHLQNPALSLIDVAAELGFGDQSSFSKAFKRWFNTTPAEYRKAQMGMRGE